MNYENASFLLQSLKKGDQQAFLHVVDKYSQRLFAYAVTLSNDHALAEDIIQNVFLKTWQQRKKLHIHSSLDTYLLRSVYNEFINQYKKNRSTMMLEQKYFQALEKASSLEDESLFKQNLARILAEVQMLPPRCKEVFMLSRKEGLTNIEISEYLNISIKSVEANITKAFSILRKKM
ncbi:MAG: RNA polymerase sigma-70 factor [Cyclobacteriaceae bacterium]